MPETETHEVRDEVVDVEVGVVRTEDDADDTAHDVKARARSLAIRHLAQRQLSAGQDLSTRLVEAATDASVAVTRAPATVVTEIRSGATLPTAISRSGSSVREAVGTAGQQARAAVGEYVGTQAALPNAVVVGAADIAETVLRAQGAVAATAVNTAFSVAVAATQGGDVRETIGRERAALTAKRETVRGDVTASWDRARDELRGAVRDYDELATAFG
ncbi:hypothetical protein [Mycolicibacterium arenosum]|uniref:ESX-1 secretion-associated protein EspA/EspE-like domain-containing protein n=1 Tax=Mycolicibacterium arenosum TaxID=2952157 RepID=A0ABT1M1X6_9MYCO|nr:hypothetical protein [Mycolicibacterium sp. CAU 1645]MCP9272279.1 hypothetical protein [Mycolicibacterium sp. CAU 1645]